MNYRITHYSDENRSTQWTSYWDLVKNNNFETGFNIYKQTENKYVRIFQKLLEDNCIKTMKIIELEDYSKNEKWNEKLFEKELYDKLNLKNNAEYPIEEIMQIIKLCLREILWCKIVFKTVYIHIGYDLYTYIGGIKKVDSEFIENELKNGITIEEFESPYL